MTTELRTQGERAPAGAASPRLHVVVAMPAEARPLVDHLVLRVDPRATSVTSIFTGAVTLDAHRTIACRLIVAGVGRVAAATAAGVLHGLALAEDAGVTPSRPPRWLSLGICGHRRRPLGDIVLASAVHEVATGYRLALHRDFDAPCDVVDLETHDDVVTTYPSADRAVDMEAAGLVHAARRCGAGKGDIACLKIVSDNAAHPLVDGVGAPPRLAVEAVDAHMTRLLPTLDVLLARWFASADRDET